MRSEGFGAANLPYGVFRRPGEQPRVGARYGDGILDLGARAADRLLDDPAGVGVFAQPSLNAFIQGTALDTKPCYPCRVQSPDLAWREHPADEGDEARAMSEQCLRHARGGLSR